MPIIDDAVFLITDYMTAASRRSNSSLQLSPLRRIRPASMPCGMLSTAARAWRSHSIRYSSADRLRMSRSRAKELPNRSTAAVRRCPQSRDISL